MGFTLIEVMVVVAILGMLATLVAVNVVPQHANAQLEKARIDLRQIASAAELFRMRQHRLPTLAELGAPDEHGNRALLLGPDPWGHDYELTAADPLGPVHVRSAGPDGIPG
ncbi:MAG TPA: type II secretion system protein GspG, partial [Planctomycetota bacterium]|nr:type II secretion system protein GspG [Planctomycetota bacterium]